MEAKHHKKLLSIAASISMILLSASAFLLSVNRTFAEPIHNDRIRSNEIRTVGAISGCEVYPFGIVSGKAYWIEYNTSGWNFKTSDVSKWTD